MYKIEIVDPAKNDLREIGLYIAVDLQSPEAAMKRLDLIDEKIQSLKKMPAKHTLVQDNFLAAQGYRMVVAKSHLIFFLISNDETPKRVYIMRVLYARRNWTRILKMESLPTALDFPKKYYK